MTADLVGFLLARLSEDEASARACTEVFPAPWDVSERGHSATVRADEPNFRIVAELEQSDSIDGWLGDRLDHIARHDPARVLAEVAAKRRIVGMLSSIVPAKETNPIKSEDAVALADWTLRLLALPYADHNDYRQEWGP